MNGTWLVDLPRNEKLPKLKSNSDSNRNDVNRARWNVEEVMYYYGEWIGNKESAVFIMRNIERRISDFHKMAFTHRMNMVRDYLVYELEIKNVSFISSYRRLEDD